MNPLHLVLTDCQNGVWVESCNLGPDALGASLSVRKSTLRGGLQEGVEFIEVDNGVTSFSVLPTRGMGLWKASHRGIPIGWESPVRHPVHPKLVNLADRNGLGWLTGFNELLCRCGLAWAGPPGLDEGFPLTLHGRIANTPAHRIEILADPSTGTLKIRGEVEETGLFYPRLQLTSEYATDSRSNAIRIHDRVVNLGGQPSQFQMLYHLNVGQPILEQGSRVHVAMKAMVPQTERAAQAMDHWQSYGPPTPGFSEEVYLFEPQAGPDGRAVAVLHDARANRAVAVRWPVKSLPCFTLWKNTVAINDGYVTGLEPATCFPNFRAKEREQGRVIVLEPGEVWEAEWQIEVYDSEEAVRRVVSEVETLQKGVTPRIRRTPMN